MNKKLIALAVAGAFAPAVALAQGTSVTVYGTLNSAWNYVEAKGATVAPGGVGTAITGTNLLSGANLPSRSRVDVDSSNIGFRVREDLGGGMNAWGQCESSANTDAGGGALCSRNSGVGIDGAFGNVFLGQWDTPYKQQGSQDVMGNTHIVAWVAIMSSPGLNVPSTTAGNGATAAVTSTATTNGTPLSFDRRQQNTINYYTPNWNGFQAKLAYGANEEKFDTVGTVNGRDPSMWSANLTYDNGPLYISAAYEQHDDYGSDILGAAAATGNITESDDTAWRIGAGYKFGNFRIVAFYEELSYETTALNAGVAASGEVERDAWMIGASYTAAPHYFAVSYADADNWDCGGTVAAAAATIARCTNTGASSWALKYAYSLSKRTEVFAHYVNVDNDSNAQYTFGVNALQVVAPGADPEGFGIGLKHTF